MSKEVWGCNHTNAFSANYSHLNAFLEHNEKRYYNYHFPVAFIGAVLPVYAAGPKQCSGVPEGTAAGGGESSGETLTASRTTERQAAHG